MRLRAALLAGTVLGLCASTDAQAKWTCPYTDMVSISYYCYGINPVPVNDLVQNEDKKKTEQKEKEEAKKAEENAAAKKKNEEAVGKEGGQGEKAATTPSPPPKNTLGELVFGPHDETKDIKLKSTEESEFQKVSLAFSNSIIEATIMALAAKRKTEEDAKEVAKLIQEAQQSETVRQDLAFNNKVKNKLVELQALKQALIAKNVEIEARKQKVLETSDQTKDQGDKKPSGSSDTTTIPLNDPEALQRAKDQAERDSIADYFKFFGTSFEDGPPLTEEEKKKAEIDQLSLNYQQNMGLSKEQADQLAKQVAGEMDQAQGTQEDKARQQALKMQQDPSKYGLTKDQAEKAATQSKNYGDPNAPGRKTEVTAENASKYAGQYWGKNQECASLTKAFAPGVGPASTWKPGAQVQGNTDMKPGTPIATFNFNGNYGPSNSPGGASGVSHTGIYLGQNSTGVQILHQWNGSGGAKVTTIPWNSWNGNSMEGGSKYYAIK